MARKVVQCGYMSGDTYSAAALLAAEPKTRIILITDTRGSGQYKDKSDLILRIYTEAGVRSQVTVIDISKEPFTINQVWSRIKNATKDTPLPNARTSDLAAFLRELCTAYEPRYQWPRSITAVTGWLANDWKDNPQRTQQAVARAWKVGKLPTDQKFALYEYMAQVFAKTKFDLRNNIVVLWSRQSGKSGGAHLELDSSFQGIRQLAEAFCATNRATVVLAGDERGTKMHDLAARSVHIVNATEMWKAPVWERMFGDAKFLAQFAFFKYLADDYNVVHVGMRSGLLEAMALLGMQTFYLEGVGSQSGNRMLAFSSNGITYTRIQIDRAPGLTGRLAEQKQLHTPGKLDHAFYQGRRENWKDPAFSSFKGLRPERRDQASWRFTKAKLLDIPLNPPAYQNGDRLTRLGDDLRRARGFTQQSIHNIVRLVTGAFRN
jgi:hypothetical protein